MNPNSPTQDPYITLILPAYNEVARIAGTIQTAQRYFAARGYTYEIIVAADGDDGTREVVREIGRAVPAVRVIGSEERRGKGYGIREAMKLAQGHFVGFADADDKTPIEDLDKVLELLLQERDVVIGSRAEPESRIDRQQPLYRRVGSRLFAFFMHAVAGLPEIKDTQCGFKFFGREAALDLFRRQRIDGYMFDVEILYLARKVGYRIGQVPVRWKDDGDSRLRLLRDNLRHAVDLLRVPLLHRNTGQPLPAALPTPTPLQSTAPGNLQAQSGGIPAKPRQ
jgi:dolichyl-phosphate beta-glucosyltransferase